MLGKRCWELEMKVQGKSVWKSTKRKIERLKCAFFKVGRRTKKRFGRKMNQDVCGNWKLFWKEVSKTNGGNVEKSKRINVGNRWVALEEAELRRIWREYYEDLFNIDIQEHVAVHLCYFDGVRR